MKCLSALPFVLGLLSCAHAATFIITPLTADYQSKLKSAGLWSTTCPVALERLRDVTVSYYDFDGKAHQDGHIIVLDTAAPYVVNVFKTLYDAKFPIKKIQPTSAYQGDDKKSMEDDNTSSFNCRPVTGGTLPSIHGYGLAIDINTIENPYISFAKDNSGQAQILPYQGTAYVNRHNARLGMAELIVKVFARNGFIVWGGQWNSPIDYQHFQPSRLVAQLLAAMTPQDAAQFFKVVVYHPRAIMKLSEEDYDTLIKLYQKNPSHFLRTFNERIEHLETRDAKGFLKEIE